MMEYHAAYYDGDDGWIVAIVLVFPGVNSQGKTLRSASCMVRDALRMMAQAHLDEGERLPTPNPKAKDRKAIFTEKIPGGIRVPMKVPS